MQIGSDTGSPVINPDLAQSFIGSIQNLEIYSGQRLPTTSASGAKTPNVVLIFTDDMGYADLGSYGSKTNRTPHLDQLAKDGTRLTRFYVPQPVCSASRAALLTGCYPSRVSIQGALGPGAKTGLNLNETTLAEIAKQKNYATAAIGKWHLGDHPTLLPTNHGFDQYFGLPYSNDMWPHHPENANRKVPFPALPLIENTTVIDPDVTAEDQTHLTTQYTERAVQFIQQNKEKPFFLYLAHSMPHVPLFVSARHDKKSPHGLYADVIEEIDWSTGEILRALKENGLDENTLVIFTSDNGPWLNYGTHSGVATPLREGKGTVWEGGVRVPFIARWPGVIPAGTTMNEPAMTIDMLPTIAKILDAKLPDHRIDGLDVLPLLTAQSGAKNPHAAYYFYHKQNELQAVMSGDGEWKLYLPHAYRTVAEPTRSDGQPVSYGQRKLEAPELYHLATDISETTNVAGKNPAVLDRLLMLAESAREDLGDRLSDRHGVGVREAAKIAAP
ncbi:sulfatase [Phragmitibacter flavus]|uniref:Sulfatase n=2 Tax=Phragmitibacter flavus TaxID=2576071 RepID=A0A5R8KG70_9BACT|nr:sulfatase [Phragmitibacter flavus]